MVFGALETLSAASILAIGAGAGAGACGCVFFILYCCCFGSLCLGLFQSCKRGVITVARG